MAAGITRSKQWSKEYRTGWSLYSSFPSGKRHKLSVELADDVVNRRRAKRGRGRLLSTNPRDIERKTGRPIAADEAPPPSMDSTSSRSSGGLVSGMRATSEEAEVEARRGNTRRRLRRAVGRRPGRRGPLAAKIRELRLNTLTGAMSEALADVATAAADDATPADVDASEAADVVATTVEAIEVQPDDTLDVAIEELETSAIQAQSTDLEAAAAYSAAAETLAQVQSAAYDPSSPIPSAVTVADVYAALTPMQSSDCPSCEATNMRTLPSGYSTLQGAGRSALARLGRQGLRTDGRIISAGQLTTVGIHNQIGVAAGAAFDIVANPGVDVPAGSVLYVVTGALGFRITKLKIGTYDLLSGGESLHTFSLDMEKFHAVGVYVPLVIKNQQLKVAATNLDGAAAQDFYLFAQSVPQQLVQAIDAGCSVG